MVAGLADDAERNGVDLTAAAGEDDLVSALIDDDLDGSRAGEARRSECRDQDPERDGGLQLISPIVRRRSQFISALTVPRIAPADKLSERDR
jgi:hypothetical protein